MSKDTQERVRVLLTNRAIIGNRFKSDVTGVDFTFGWLEKVITDFVEQEVEAKTKEAEWQLNERSQLLEDYKDLKDGVKKSVREVVEYYHPDMGGKWDTLMYNEKEEILKLLGFNDNNNQI